ncbi:MAG TPA: hypothetical protein VF402_05630, partial [Asticcacaulis sp.]
MMCLLPAHAAAACHVRLPRHSESVLSADKRHIAFIRQVPSVNVPDSQAGELWLGDCASGETRRLLPARFSGVEATSQWTSLGSPVFSSDSRHVFVNAAYGGD